MTVLSTQSRVVFYMFERPTGGDSGTEVVTQQTPRKRLPFELASLEDVEVKVEKADKTIDNVLSANDTYSIVNTDDTSATYKNNYIEFRSNFIGNNAGLRVFVTRRTKKTQELALDSVVSIDFNDLERVMDKNTMIAQDAETVVAEAGEAANAADSAARAERSAEEAELWANAPSSRAPNPNDPDSLSARAQADRAKEVQRFITEEVGDIEQLSRDVGTINSALMNAEAAATRAETAETNAETAATNAGTARDQAVPAATQAAESAKEAKGWAIGNAEASENFSSTNNAKHYRDQAVQAITTVTGEAQRAEREREKATDAREAAEAAAKSAKALGRTVEKFADVTFNSTNNWKRLEVSGSPLSIPAGTDDIEVDIVDERRHETFVLRFIASNIPVIDPNAEVVYSEKETIEVNAQNEFYIALGNDGYLYTATKNNINSLHLILLSISFGSGAGGGGIAEVESLAVAPDRAGQIVFNTQDNKYYRSSLNHEPQYRSAQVINSSNSDFDAIISKSVILIRTSNNPLIPPLRPSDFFESLTPNGDGNVDLTKRNAKLWWRGIEVPYVIVFRADGSPAGTFIEFFANFPEESEQPETIDIVIGRVRVNVRNTQGRRFINGKVNSFAGRVDRPLGLSAFFASNPFTFFIHGEDLYFGPDNLSYRWQEDVSLSEGEGAAPLVRNLPIAPRIDQKALYKGRIFRTYLGKEILHSYPSLQGTQYSGGNVISLGQNWYMSDGVHRARIGLNANQLFENITNTVGSLEVKGVRIPFLLRVEFNTNHYRVQMYLLDEEKVLTSNIRFNFWLRAGSTLGQSAAYSFQTQLQRNTNTSVTINGKMASATINHVSTSARSAYSVNTSSANVEIVFPDISHEEQKFGNLVDGPQWLEASLTNQEELIIMPGGPPVRQQNARTNIVQRLQFFTPNKDINLTSLNHRLRNAGQSSQLTTTESELNSSSNGFNFSVLNLNESSTGTLEDTIQVGTYPDGSPKYVKHYSLTFRANGAGFLFFQVEVPQPSGVSRLLKVYFKI